MSYKLSSIPRFEREAKRLIKKYASLKEEVRCLGRALAENPDLGTPLGNNVFKIRLAIASKGKGKRGGARVITYAKVNNETVYFLSIYDKGEKATISDKEIQALIATIEKLQ